MKKIRKISLLVLLLILVNAFPVLAREEQQIMVSKWALTDLVDSQRQGIFSMSDIENNRNFTSTIKLSELKKLEENSRKKLEYYNLEKNPNYKKLNYSNNLTREDILYSIFNLISEYDSSANSQEPITFLQSIGIVKGNGKDLLLSSPASLESTISFFNRATDYLIQKNNLAGKGMLYKVENNGNTVYLFGSIHIGDHSMYPIDKKVTDAFNSSDELFVEVNVTDKSKMNYMQKEMLHSDSKTLKDDLGEELYSRYKGFMDKYGVKEESYVNLKPWAAYNTLSNLPMQVNMPNSTSLGIDRYFISKANLMNKEIKELESIELQTDVLRDFSEDEYKEMISSFIDTANDHGIDIFTNNSKVLQQIWTVGDSNALNKAISKEDNFTENLFDERDIGMADKVQALLTSNDKKTSFVVAGAAHFTPEDSVIKILENRNFKVEKL